MPRTAAKQIDADRRAKALLGGWVSLACACELLGISPDSFERHWQDVFSDGRTDAERQSRRPRLVHLHELTAAVEAGGGLCARAKAAVRRWQAIHPIGATR